MNSEIYTLATTIALVFIAELGDKTMISTAIFAVQTRRFLAVFLASILGFTLANVISVVAGFIVRQALDLSIVQLVAALLFIVVGLWMLLWDRDHVDEKAKYGITACFLAVFLSEMGDKTQLAVFSSVILHGLPLVTLTGGIVGYALANLIGLIIARVASKKVKWSQVKKYAALVMITIGVWIALSVLVD
ncbi:MAG: TMEM165/GDT1 family protein [Desulfurococcaceae archaeon]